MLMQMFYIFCIETSAIPSTCSSTTPTPLMTTDAGITPTTLLTTTTDIIPTDESCTVNVITDNTCVSTISTTDPCHCCEADKTNKVTVSLGMSFKG